MIEYLDRPPTGWFVLDVMRKTARKWDWCALMIDVDPDADAFKNYRPGARTVCQCFVHIPGKHRNRDAAWDALEDLMATRH
jgi:hypothetical protein